MGGNTGGSGASGATGAEEEEESKVVVELGSDSVAQRLKVQQSLDVGDLHFEGSSITGAQTLEFSNLQTDDLKIMGFTSFGPGSPAVRMKTLEAPLSGKASFEPYEAVVHGMSQNQIVSMTAVVVKSTEDSHVVKPNWSQYGNQPYASFWMEENRFKVQRLAPGVRMKVEEMKREAKFLEGARLKVTFWYTASSVQDQAKETARLAEADVVDDSE